MKFGPVSFLWLPTENSLPLLAHRSYDPRKPRDESWVTGFAVKIWRFVIHFHRSFK